MSTIIDCMFTSEWSGGEEVTTNGTWDVETNEVTAEVSTDVTPTGECIREYITVGECDRAVCGECHLYVMVVNKDKECECPDCT